MSSASAITSTTTPHATNAIAAGRERPTPAPNANTTTASATSHSTYECASPPDVEHTSGGTRVEHAPCPSVRYDRVASSVTNSSTAATTPSSSASTPEGPEALIL